MADDVSRWERSTDAMIERAELMDRIIEHTIRTGHAITVLTMAFGREHQRTMLACTDCDALETVIIDPTLCTWVQHVREELTAY